MAERKWTCQRISKGKKCGIENPKRKLYCVACGKKRPPTKRPDHMKALDDPYEYFVAVNGGDFCGICGRVPEPGKKLHRDHDHRSGAARGVLCFPCNLQLKNGYTPEWHRAAADYLERAGLVEPASATAREAGAAL